MGLRLIYTRPSGEEVASEINGIGNKTSVTLALNPVFSDFYDTVFSIPLYQGEERLRVVAKHLKSNRFGTSFEQQEKYVNFHGYLYLPSFYNTHPGRIRVYRDRENRARFLIFEDIANPDNIVGYEWRIGQIIPLERDSMLKINGSVSTHDKETPLYYLHRSNVFREFDQRLDKSIETIIASSNDTRLSTISMGTGRFSFRVKRNISAISFEGQRSNYNITRDDRARYPIRIVRLDDKSEIKIGYKNPDVQGEFIVEGLNWEDDSPVVLIGYFNISTITEMLRRSLLRGIKASNWMLETFDFYEGIDSPNLRNPVRSYKIKRTESGEKFLVIEPRISQDELQALYFSSGGNMASLFLSTNCATAVLIESRRLGYGENWNSKKWGDEEAAKKRTIWFVEEKVSEILGVRRLDAVDKLKAQGIDIFETIAPKQRIQEDVSSSGLNGATTEQIAFPRDTRTGI